jgi:hypothetical protein
VLDILEKAIYSSTQTSYYLHTIAPASTPAQPPDRTPDEIVRDAFSGKYIPHEGDIQQTIGGPILHAIQPGEPGPLGQYNYWDTHKPNVPTNLDPISQFLNENIPSVEIMGREITPAEIANALLISALPLLAVTDFKGAISEKIPKTQEVKYFKDTGVVELRNVYEILGTKIRSPFYREAVGKSGIDFFNYEQPKEVVVEPEGIAQGPQWRPSTTSPDISTIYSGKIAYAEPSISELWQPKTGIYEPPIRTGQELGFLNLKPVLRPIAGPIAEYDPIFQVVDPYITELNKTLDLLSSNWQPKTGIQFPKEQPKTIIDVFEGKQSPFDIAFKPKPAEPIITKIRFDAEENLVATKYGLTEPATKQWQPLTGTWEQPKRTGEELWTTVWPKPMVRSTGKLSIWEPMLNMGDISLESGLDKLYEGIIRLKPTGQKRIFDWKEIIKTPETKTIGGQVQTGEGQVLIMEEPIINEQKLISETEKVTDVFTESSTSTISDTGQFTDMVNELEQEQILDSSRLSMFPPMYISLQGTQSLSGVLSEQKQASVQKTDMITISKIINDSIQSSLQDIDRISLQDHARVLIHEHDFIIQAKNVFNDLMDVIKYPSRNTEEQTSKEIKLKLPKSEEQGYPGIVGSFIVEVHGKQYSHGKKIGDDSFHKASGPLSYEDALSLGMDIVGRSEKATFKLEPSSAKPGKLRSGIPDFSSEIFKFKQKDNNTWVEMPRYRIDSPEEIAAITMKGINARRK